MPFNKKLYDVLSYISRYALPAIAGLYYTLAEVWNLPYGPQISATIAGVILAINVLLGVDSAQYHATLIDKDKAC